MIKTFISHSSDVDSFVNRLEENLKRENIGLDVFVDHHKNRPGDNTQIMIDEVKNSIIFIPIMTKESLSKNFVLNEIRTALATPTVNIFPIKIKVKTDEVEVPKGLKIEFEKSDKVKGILWSDFSNEGQWEIRYQELKEAIYSRLNELDLLRKDENFYQDVEHIDIILKRPKPTHAEIKIIVDVYLKKESYQNYFFGNLENVEWLSYLYHYGFFRHNPEPIEIPEQVGTFTIPYWRPLNYLEKTSLQITDETNARFGNIIMNIVRNHSKYDENGKRIENHLTDWSFVKIMSNLPQKYITIVDLKFISNYFDANGEKTLLSSEIGKSLLPNIIKTGDKEKAADLFEIVIKNKWKEREPIPIIEEYWFNELMENNKTGICNLFPIEAVKILVNQIFSIVSQEEKEFNNVWIPTIEDHLQNSFPDRYQNILVRTTRDILLYAVKENQETVKELIVNLLGKNHSIFRRTAIYIISNNWDTYSTLFWESFGEEIFNDIFIKHEVYEFLHKNFEFFTEEQKYRIIEWIENCCYGLPDQYKPHIKQEWFYAIKGSKFQKAKDRYNYYKNITNIEPEHPGFSFWMGEGGVQVGEISPLKMDKLLEMANQEISDYLNKYVDTDEGFNKPSKEGLEDALLEAIKRNPAKFSLDLHSFIDVPQRYQYKILWGFVEAWKSHKEFDWNSVLNFCQEIISKDEFWSCIYAKTESNYRELIVSQIATLIEEGTRDDSNSYDETYLPLTEKIVFKIILKVETNILYPDDLSLSIANSSKGRIFTAAIVYSLRYARLNKGSLEVRWPIKIKDDFTKRLDKTFDNSLEFSFILGMYLPNLMYLDKKWVEENISRIFPKENKDHWKAAMEGYILHTKVHTDIYHLVKKGGDYFKAIRTDFGKEEVRKRIIQHFLNGMEDLTNHESLFSIILKDWKTKEVSEMISFFWTLRNSEKLSDDQRAKILLFWNTTFNHYKDKNDLSDEDKTILSSCGKLAVFLDRINEKYLEWLKLSARFLNYSFNPFFVEYLDKLADETPYEVGLVYLEILENDIYPEYDQEHIKSIMLKLYKSGQRGIANKICNLYGNKEIGFLREIYDENN